MGKNIFNSILVNRPKNNVFDLSHDVKMSCNAGQLVPIMVRDAVPGDRFNLGAEAMIRMAPMVAPPMHRVHSTIHYYFVPNRLLWPNWEKFITNTKLEGADIPAHPYISLNDTSYTKLCDYMGIPIPPTGADKENVNALPFSAYQLVYNEYYRDQNLIKEVDYLLVDGDNSAVQNSLTEIRRRAWEHDYFTAALPFAQKGEAVAIPIGTVELDPDGTTPGQIKLANNRTTPPLSGDLISDGGNFVNDSSSGEEGVVYDPDGSLVVEPTTINDLRRAFKLQEWLEKNARAGTRYIENILMHFGVKSPDKRLQRPEYITGVKTPIVISEVLNTTGTDDAPQGNMAGHGIAVVQSNNGSYFCEEHGWIIGIMSIMPMPAYQQGIDRMFLRKLNTDYFWPSFANIGEQEVQKRELYAFQGSNGDGTFGYVPRYAEYKYCPSRVAGQFRTTLDFWHWGRIFANPPQLNQEFVECNPDHRIFAVTDPDQDKFWCHVYNKVKAVRPMPKYGTPMF